MEGRKERGKEGESGMASHSFVVNAAEAIPGNGGKPFAFVLAALKANTTPRPACHLCMYNWEGREG